ncbi:MAG: hypothetical protein RLZZ191_1773, partial [Pseudomonadota bacterium]
YEGWYSVRDEAYYDETELTEGEGGQKLSPQGTPVEWTVEESWFFRLSKYEQPLLEYYAAHPDFIRPDSRKNETVKFVEGGLKDLSVSRTSFDWGVKVPGSENHVMYVWLDALTTYISAIGFPDDTEEWRKFWPANVHIIGKDIVRFHTVYWPAFLMSAGLPLPKQVFGHGFLLSRGEKMSKSLGNVVDPMQLAELFGIDALRYFLLREVSFGQDGSYSPEAIVTRVNADLANSFGNLAQRTLSLIFKNCEGYLPAIRGHNADDTALLDLVGATVSQHIPAHYEDLAMSQGLESWMQAVFACNAYVSRRQIRNAWKPCLPRCSFASRNWPSQLCLSFPGRRPSFWTRWAFRLMFGISKMLAHIGIHLWPRAITKLPSLSVYSPDWRCQRRRGLRPDVRRFPLPPEL